MTGDSNKHFRSVDEWKSALMTLPENKFFELFRSVLGNIKTPFNKQRLLEDLFNLLSRNEIQKIIAAYIDEQDQKVIAAIALLNEPAQEEMDSFFTGELSRAELYALIINLEERLILYRIRDNDVLRLSLNPVLEKVLAPMITDIRPLFPFLTESSDKQIETPLPGRRQETCILDGRIMAAFFSFIVGQEEIFAIEAGTEAEGAAFAGAALADNSFKENLLKEALYKETLLPRIRKKILDEGKKKFPSLDIKQTLKTMLTLELFGTEGRSLIPRREKIIDFCVLSSMERYEYWAAAVYLCLEETESNAYNGGYPGNRLKRIASFIHRFLHLIESENLYPEITLRRLGELLEREEEGAGNVLGLPVFGRQAERGIENRGAAGQGAANLHGPFPFESLIAVMEKTDLLEREGSCWKAGPVFAVPSNKVSDERDTAGIKPVIVMDAAFSFILYPEISFDDAMALAEFSSVKEITGDSVRFELTRQSVVRGFDLGIDSAAMMELLGRLSGNRIDENLGWTLKEWESRHAGVSLSQGVILTLAEDLRYLAETRQVSSMIQRTLAPGVYLLSSMERSEAAAVLRKAGVDIIAQPPSRAGGKGQEAGSGSSRTLGSGTESSKTDGPRTEAGRGYVRHFFSHLSSKGAESFYRSDSSLSALSKLKSKEKAAEFSSGEADSVREKFRGVLDKMKLSKAEREELTARIERRLVLTNSQLEGASLRYEKLEARGLDYAGKCVIAKQAIEAGSLLDVSWPGSGGTVSRVIGRPQTLEKKEGDSVLVLKNSDAAEAGDTAFQETIRIPLGKISLMRRIKQSIFEG